LAFGKKTLCHNDFHTKNILYDGDRFWLIDWEIAALSHPFYDLAYFAIFQLMSEQEGNKLLAIYLEREPTENELQDFKLLRRIAYGFIATAMLSETVSFEHEVKTPSVGEEELHTLKEFFIAMDLGKINLLNKRDLYRSALLYLRASAAF